jgi:hypothetical protein
MGHGPRPTLVHGGPPMDGGAELARAWPPATSARQRSTTAAEEGEWDTGVSAQGSSELGRR